MGRCIIIGIIIGIILAIIVGLECVISLDSWCGYLLSSIISGIVGIALQAVYNFIDTCGQGIKLWFQSKIQYRNEEIRLSISYLYKIEVDGDYLLVRGNRMKDRYQPIGGVYKYFPEAKPFLESINYLPDVRMGNNDETDDLRIIIKGKYLLRFMKWFNLMQNREYDPTREFYEEILKDGLLPEMKFRHMKYRKIKVHNVGIEWSEPLQTREFVYADIFEVALNDEQKDEIRNAILKSKNQLCLVSIEDIRKRRHNSIEMNLGNNVLWLIEGE